MRRKLLFVITTFVLSLISSSQALAQNLRWTGKSLEEIAAGGQGSFYLYNVGKKMFLSQGGLWGTSTEVSESGLQMQALTKVSPISNKYYVQTSLKMETAGNNVPGYLNFADGVKIQNNKGHFFLDQDKFPCGQWTFTQVTDNPKVYTISVKITESNSDYNKQTFYLSAESSSFAVEPTTVANGEYSQWMLVTLTEIKEDFNNAENPSVSSPTPAPFFFSCPGFCRRDLGISKWCIRESKQQLIADKINPLSSEGTEVTSFTKNITPLDAFSGNSLKYTYYIGNGYIKNIDDNLDSDLNPTPDQYFWQSLYGKDWTANIHGQSGIIQQTISARTAGLIEGWYKVTCKGFSTDRTGKLFAYSGTTRPNTENDKYQTKTFTNPTETPATYVKASRLINDGTSAFEQSVLVYVSEGEDLTFGVEVEGGDVNSWTCFDSFTLGYCGTGEYNLIIDEEQPAIKYLNDQVIENKNQILRLKRDLKTRQWNSLVLPVNLNAEQVTTAFGGSTKLAKLNRAEGNRIYFELVSLDDKEAPAIEAGQMYIINPQNSMKKGQTPKCHSAAMTKPEIEDYYTINQVTFNEAVTDEKIKNKLMPGASSDGGQMQMVGTYIAITKTEGAENPIPAKSYVLSEGKWIYATNGVSKVKGLRGWIEAGIDPEKENETSSKSLIINIDGVDEEEVSTGIDGLFVDGAETNTSISKTGVYSLSGQKISDKTNLPKGIYIVNGRKMIVK